MFWIWVKKTWRLQKEHAALPGLVVGCCVHGFLPSTAVKALLANSNLLSALISVGAILAGFFCTGMTVVLSLEGKPVLALMDQMRIRSRVSTGFWTATKWVLTLTGTCLACLIMIPDNEKVQRVCASLVIGVTVSAGFSSYGAIQNIAAIMRRHATDAEDSARRQ